MCSNLLIFVFLVLPAIAMMLIAGRADCQGYETILIYQREFTKYQLWSNALFLLGLAILIQLKCFPTIIEK